MAIEMDDLKRVIESDAFTDMPQSTQLLYINLAMNADEFNYVRNTKSVMRQIRAREDDLKILFAKHYISNGSLTATVEGNPSMIKIN